MHISNNLREKYLLKMKYQMNNTYDPESMAKMPMVNNYPEFNYN